jgi:hypothetical protein
MRSITVKKAATSAVIAGLLWATVPADASDGVFGLKQGKQPQAYGCTRSAEGGGYVYDCPLVPKPDPRIEAYVVHATEKTGICYVKGISHTQRDDSAGLHTMALVDALAAEFAEQYSKDYASSKILVSQSLWYEPADWMKSIAHGERFYSYSWQATAGQPYADNVDAISVGAKSRGGTAGYAVVEFYYANNTACERAMRQMDSKAF